jgi:hypothetical protein
MIGKWWQAAATLTYHNVLYDTSARGGVKEPLLDSKGIVNGELCTAIVAFLVVPMPESMMLSATVKIQAR